MLKINLYYLFTWFIFLSLSLSAADFEPPAPPDDVNSAMFTLQDICNRFNTGADGVKRGAYFVKPPIGAITKMGCTLDEAMNAAPVADNTNGATSAEVVSGKTFWGLRTDGTWGLQTGTLPIQTFDNTAVNQPAGYYDAFNLANIETDLIAENVKTGVAILGVVGTDSGSNFATSPCASPIMTEPRFTDNNDGTVTDNLTQLIWMKNANCSEIKLNWGEALNYTNTISEGICGLSDGSLLHDWRLPNIKELQSLIDFAQISPSLPEEYSFANVQIDTPYWSSTTFKTGSVWTLNLNDGSMGTYGKFGTFYVWAVRGGE